jgi:hypothetical protein
MVTAGQAQCSDPANLRQHQRRRDMSNAASYTIAVELVDAPAKPTVEGSSVDKTEA